MSARDLTRPDPLSLSTSPPGASRMSAWVWGRKCNCDDSPGSGWPRWPLAFGRNSMSMMPRSSTARAAVGGNRLALVVADLPLSSSLLHRRVAALTARTDGIGVDRLVIAVTHTHAGPGHFFEATGYNDEGSSVLGFDPVMVDSLAARIARAVHNAAKDLRPARVAWGSRAVWGQTRIRSLPAMLRNIPLPTAPPDAPAGL